MFLTRMEAHLAEELGKHHQELLETTWEQIKGKEFKGCSYLSFQGGYGLLYFSVLFHRFLYFCRMCVLCPSLLSAFKGRLFDLTVGD